MLTEANIPIFKQAGIDLVDMAYSSLTTGMTEAALLDLVGAEIAAPAIKRWQEFKATQKKQARARVQPNPAQMEEQVADHIMQHGWLAMEAAWRGEAYDLVKEVKQAQSLYAENQLPAELITVFSVINHQNGERKGTAKGQIGGRVRKWGGSAVNMTVRLDARIASRKKGAKKKEEIKTLNDHPVDPRGPESEEEHAAARRRIGA